MNKFITSKKQNLQCFLTHETYSDIDGFKAYICDNHQLPKILQVLYYYKFVNDNDLNGLLATHDLQDFRNTPKYMSLMQELEIEPNWF